MGNEQAKTEREKQAKREREKQAKITLNKQAINSKTYCELIKLGFELKKSWRFAHEAAKKFPNDTFSAVDWITSQHKYKYSQNANRNDNADKIKRLNWNV
eukprot:50171_1